MIVRAEPSRDDHGVKKYNGCVIPHGMVILDMFCVSTGNGVLIVGFLVVGEVSP